MKKLFNNNRFSNYSEADVTDQNDYLNRREFIKRSTKVATALSIASYSMTGSSSILMSNKASASCLPTDKKINRYRNITGGTPNSLSEISRYNNYYEFSTNKEAVIHLSKELTTEPWSVKIDGEVEKIITLDVEKIIRLIPSEERIYSLRCVEGWSMVIPWTGFTLCQLLNQVKPTSKAKYVEFISLLRPEEMIGQRIQSLDWPYRESLTIEEATHPLTFIATGLYGEELPKQNGAPLRLVVPWKYAFKSIKAITHIRLHENRPVTSWNKAAASEYGYFANVNPNVPHPRWTQRRENRIGELRKHRTKLFNGYAEHVAHLYKGMDLEVNF